VSAAERTKVLEAAQKHLAKGNYDKAIGEFRKIVHADPGDVRTWLKIGDLYTRKGARKEAIETYLKVASQYGDQGFFLKAVAVYKQILKLDPARLDVQLQLAGMYEMLELSSDALSTYEHVAASYARNGDIDSALTTLAKMTELDPENIPVRIKYAEALSKAGRTKEAADEFQVGARLLNEQGRIDDYIKVGERLLFHRAEDMNLARDLARLYLERDDPKRALAKLQLCFKADPKDTATLELLAEAFNQLGQLPKTISVYREVARIHQEANRPEERARTLKKILELDPGDQEARQALASFAAGSGANVRRDIAPPASAVVEPSRSAVRESEQVRADEEDDAVELLDGDSEDDELIIVEEEVSDELPEAVPAAKSQRPASIPSVPPDVQREAQIARLLTECDVFLRYGLKQKVIEQLHSVLEIEPMHVEARERLKDMYLRDGKIDDAIGELLTLADILAEEKSAAAVLYLRQILELDPSHDDAIARLNKLGAHSKPPPPDEDSAEALAPPMPAGSQADDEVFFLEEEGTESTTAESVESADGLELIDDDSKPPVNEPALDVPDEAPLPPRRAAIVPPPSKEARIAARVSGPDLDDPLAPMSPAEFDEVPLRPSSPGQPASESARRSIPPGAGEVEEILDECDFFIAQGLLEEARVSLTEALNTHPSHPLIEDKLREVAQLAANAAVAAQSSSPAGSDQSFELAERLAEEFEEVEPTSAGSDVLDVEQVFAQFKKGVEQQVGMEDTETHFDLGIAYKEMGLLDDAMNEFRLCLQNPTRVCIAETMIGLCFIEKGDTPEAISHFKKGLYAESKTDREELGLYFELGHAYELLHDPKEALYYYQKVQKRDPGFRDVNRRIQNLSQPGGSGAPPMAPDDIDRAFDDLMGED
jgi:pilus assembly protein FimV